MEKGQGKGKTILLVDDEEHLRVTVQDFLTFQGYTVELADSGEEALKILEKQTPDLIILDISMPGIGGIGFLQRLARDGVHAPPVLVLTARANLQSFFDGLDIAGFVSKPCEKSVLLAHIERILGDQKPTRASEASDAPMRVLLAEDDPEISEVISRLFSRHGHHVTRVDNGPGVLEMVVMTGADVVVLKQCLTRLNGSAVASLLRAMPTTRDLPIVLYDMVALDAIHRSSFVASKAPVDRYITVHEASEILDAVEQVVGSA